MCFNGSEFSVSRLQVRIQLGQGSAVDVTKNMLKNEGFGAFYKVISLHLMLLINEALEYFFDPQYSVTHQSNQVAIYMAAMIVLLFFSNCLGYVFHFQL